MAKISVCIEMVFGEVDFYDRPAKVAQAGFKAVEFWGTGNKDLDRLRVACQEAGVQVAGFVGLPGVTLVEKTPSDTLLDSMAQSAAEAEKLGTNTLIVTVGNEREGISREEQLTNIVENLKVVAPSAQRAGLKLAVEPLNTLVDHKGYFLDSTAEARQIVERVASPAVGILYDVYHMQIMEGNLIETIRANIDIIHHVHIADVPGRHEPGSGEINYRNVLKAIDEAGYKGYCGLEFRPSDSSEAALEQTKDACGL